MMDNLVQFMAYGQYRIDRICLTGEIDEICRPLAFIVDGQNRLQQQRWQFLLFSSKENPAVQHLLLQSLSSIAEIFIEASLHSSLPGHSDTVAQGI